MATTPTLADAYRQVRAAETKAIKDMDSIRDAFLHGIDDVAGQLPDEAASSPAGLYIARVRMAVAGVFGFDLAQLKQTYGLVETPEPAPTAAPEG